MPGVIRSLGMKLQVGTREGPATRLMDQWVSVQFVPYSNLDCQRKCRYIFAYTALSVSQLFSNLCLNIRHAMRIRVQMHYVPSRK